MKRRKNNKGFTLIELLVSLVILGIALVVVYSIITRSQRSYSTQEEITRLQELARTALSIMSKEIKLAGYNPTGTFTDTTGAALEGIEYAATSPSTTDNSFLIINSDLDGSGVVGDAPNEKIGYYLVQENNGLYTLKRASNSGTAQPFIQNIESMDITYHLYDSGTRTYTDISTAGTELTSDQREDIYSISIELTLRTTNKVADLNDYIRRSIGTDITLKQVESISCRTAPSDPATVTVSDHPCDDGTTLDVTWAASTSTEITGYEIHVFDATTSTEVKTAYTNAATTDAEISGLTAGTSYNVLVLAVCGDYKSTGTTGTGTPVADTPSPANPGSLDVKWCPQGVKSHVYLTWYKSADDYGDVTKAFKYHITKNTTEITGLSPDGSPVSGDGSSMYTRDYEEADPSAAYYQIYTEWICGGTTLTSSPIDFSPSPVNFNSHTVPAPTLSINQTATDVQLSWTEAEIYSGVRLSDISGCVQAHKIYRCEVLSTDPDCTPSTADYLDTTYLSSPYSTALPTLGKKYCYSITTLTDTAEPSAESGMSNVVCTSSTTCPNINIVSPSDGVTVSGTITVSAVVNNSPTSVELTVVQAGSTVAGPFTMTFSAGYYKTTFDTTTVSNGSYTLKVTAKKTGCADQISSINVTVSNGFSSNCPFKFKEFKIDDDRIEFSLISTGTDFQVYGMKFNWTGDTSNEIKKIEFKGDAAGAKWDTIWESNPGKSSPKSGICPSENLSSGDCARTEDKFQNGSSTEDVKIITSDYRSFKLTFTKKPYKGTNFFASFYKSNFSSCGSSCPTPTCDTVTICPFDYQNYSVNGNTVSFEIKATDTTQTIKGFAFKWGKDDCNRIHEVRFNGSPVWTKSSFICSGEKKKDECININDVTLNPSDGWITVEVLMKDPFKGDNPEVKIYLTDPNCSDCASTKPDCIKKKP